MIIRWLGHAMFEIKDEEKDLTVITDPYAPEVGYPVVRRKSDVLTMSHDHYDHNHSASVEAELILTGEVETEYRGLKISSLTTYHDDSDGRKRGLNHVFRFEEELKLAHLGDFGEPVLRDEVKEFLQGTDILLVPVGGVYTIGPEEAVELIKEVKPAVVIPMHYRTAYLKFDLRPVDDFLSIWGSDFEKPGVALKIDSGSLPEKTKVVVLELEV
jgi:L-ascorbate metabolism protein UlaG (beta-lactamase superfamily)